MMRDGYCQICKRPTVCILASENAKVYLCRDCSSHFFPDFLSKNEKFQLLFDAMLLAQKNNISTGLALNVKNGKYSLKEAKRRQYLKNREKAGKSVDIYSIGIRMPGGFGSRQ